MRNSFLLGLILLLSLGLASCKGQSESEAEKFAGNVKIAVMNPKSYYESVGKILPIHFPNITFEVLPLDLADLDHIDKQIDEANPDIVVTWSPSVLASMIEQGSLRDLKALISKDKFDVDHMRSSVVRYLEKLGNGSMYGLAPTFIGSAIYYNIKLFDQYGVPYPTDQMSWEELYRLTARFPVEEGKDRVYGFRYWGGISNQLSLQARAEHLRYYDAAGEKLDLNSETWLRLFQTVVETNKKGVIYTNPSDLFLEGKAAMTYGDSGYITLLGTKGDALKWGIISSPSNSQDRSINQSIVLNEIYSIYANASNPELAWEIVKFVNGEEIAKVQFRSLPTRIAYSKEKGNVSLEPFYRLEMDTFGDDEDIRLKNIPKSFTSALNKIVDREAEAVMKGERSAKEALERIQAEGQAQLKSVKQD
ncbi:extracellular solute-binding protein [Paenibacillus ginsengarvi]|nr:extracellular solute-binding protein [Paenibacillus ginsengarvi]